MRKHYLKPLLVGTQVLQTVVVCGVSGEDFNPRPVDDGSGSYDDGSD